MAINGEGRILTPAMHGNPMGRIAVKERISDMHVVERETSEALEVDVRKAMDEGYQPVPQTYTVTKNGMWSTGISYSIVLIKTQLKEEMI